MQAHGETSARPQLHLTSSAFGHGGSIPIQHTCEGADVAPELSWSAPPPDTKSLAVVVLDPDAPDPAAPLRTWVHWIVTGIPPQARSLDDHALPEGASVGTNDWGQRRWMGPCPPIGRHRYFFKIYALDIALRSPGMSMPALVAAIKGHVLAEGELIGTYEKLRDKRSASRGAERTTRGR